MIHYNPTVSGSLTITGSLIVTQQISGTITASYVDFNSVANKPTLVSGSAQTIANLPTGTISGSIQVLGGTGIVSGSSQITYTGISSIPSGIVSGSSQIDITSTTGYSTFSGSIATSISASNVNIASLSSSVYTSDNIQNGRLNNLESKSASVDISISNINSFTASNDNTSLNSYTSSQNTKNTTLASYTGSNDIRLTSIENKTGSLATTGSNTFFGTQTFSGSVYIANDLVVQGSSSIQYISASSVSIGTNIIQLNTANPSVRYAGLSIIDSGSVGGSGSFLYDSVQDEFIFVHRGNGTNVTSSHFVLGPETYDSLGNETYLTNNRLSKGTGKEHLNDSNITDDGTTISLGSNTTITGTLLATGTTLVSSSAQVIGILSSLNTYTGSNDTTNTAQNTRLTTIESVTGSYETKGRSIVSGSSQITYANISSIPGGIVSGSSQITFSGISSKPTTISGYGITDALNNAATSEQTIGFRYGQINNSDKTIKFDPRWNESTYDADLGTLHIYSTTAAGANYGRTGIALYHGSQYQYLTTKASTTGLFVNNSLIATAGSSPTFASVTGTITESGTGDNNAPFRFSADYSGWMSHVAGTPGSNNGWGLFWAGNSGAQYGTNGTGGPGNIWSNSANPNEHVFVGNGSTNMSIHGNTGNVWIGGELRVKGDVLPNTNNTHNLGSTSLRWANLYTNDLHLSNEGKVGGNEVDGTTGNWTIQEGQEHLYIINNKTGKKFKFSLEEIQ